MIRSLGDVYLSLTNPMSSPFVMIIHVEAISVQIRPLQRFCNVDFTGPPCLETLVLIAHLVALSETREHFKEEHDTLQSYFGS
jgi:hypothetical protein